MFSFCCLVVFKFSMPFLLFIVLVLHLNFLGWNFRSLTLELSSLYILFVFFCSVLHCVHVLFFHYASICWWAHSLILSPSHCEQSGNGPRCASISAAGYGALGLHIQRGTDGLFGKTVSSFLRNLRTDFHSDCDSLKDYSLKIFW